jgi:tetratricopeptide (TPR) repeat protein
MQFEHVKKRIINGLISEIVAIGASELELVGHAVIELIEVRKLVHHGLNKDYRPVGYTVDTFSQDGSIVGEYSAEKGYFEDSSKKDETPKFRKIENDIDHALTHGSPKKIYLIASQEEPESFRGKFRSTDHGKRYAELVNIFDARELAKYIYEFSVSNPDTAGFFGDFFPEFAQNLQNYEYYGRVPGTCENHQSEEAILNAVRAQFSAGNNVCVLYGLSGSGKTQAAIDFVHKEVDAFENYIWISGEDWRKDTPLSSIQRSRGGIPFNVAGTFNSGKTLLIVDSLERAADLALFGELQTGFNLGGVVLATSQLNTPGNPLYVATPRLSSESAAKVLGEEPTNLSDAAAKFIEACRFSPLILSTTRNISELGDVSKDDLYREVLSDPRTLSQGDGTSIMKALLRRLEANNLAALVRIADSGSSAHDSRFLAHFIGQIERVNLQRLAILQPATAPGVLKVHDLICEAVKDKPGSKAIADSIEEYVRKLCGEMVPSVIREIHLCSDQLLDANTARGARKPDWLLYSLLQVDNSARHAWAGDLHALPITTEGSLAEVLCIVDAREAHAYSIDDYDTRQQYYRACATEYQKAIDAGVEEEVRAELLHHRGKTLRRCGMLSEALSCFSDLLTIRPGWHATYGQIAHLGTQREANGELKAEGERAMQWLVGRMLADVFSVPLRVSLAAIARLRSYRAVCEYLSGDKERVEAMAEAIAMSALEGLDQFYEAYLSFTSVFGYHHMQVCVAMAEALPEILAIPPNAVEPRQWASACESLTNTATAAGRLGKHELEARISKGAATFAAALDSAAVVEPFVARVIAKTYISAGMPQKAIDRIKKVAPERVDHWLLYQKSRAQLLLDMAEPALRTAELALESAKRDAKASDRWAIYFDQLSKCAEKMQDLPLAKSYSQDAIAHCTDEQYLRDLTQRHQALDSVEAK